MNANQQGHLGLVSVGGEAKHAPSECHHPLVADHSTASSEPTGSKLSCSDDEINTKMQQMLERVTITDGRWMNRMAGALAKSSQEPDIKKRGELTSGERKACAAVFVGNDAQCGHATSCTSGYVPSPGPREEPNTNMADIAVVHHEEVSLHNGEPQFVAIPLDGFPSECDISDYDLHLLCLGRHADPFSVLGCHRVERQSNSHKRVVVVRSWIRNAKTICVKPRTGNSDWKLPDGVDSVTLVHKKRFLFQKVRY